MRKLLIDNSGLDLIRDNPLFRENINKHFDLYICYIVKNETLAIPDDKEPIRIGNLELIEELDIKTLTDTSAVYGVSKYGQAKYGAGKIFKSIRKPSGNNTRDAIIADTAKNNDCIVFTNDNKFTNKMRENGVEVITKEELTALLEGGVDNGN